MTDWIAKLEERTKERDEALSKLESAQAQIERMKADESRLICENFDLKTKVVQEANNAHAFGEGAEEWKARATSAELQVDAMGEVVEAARNHIGQNVNRPEVFLPGDTMKHRLAKALKALAEKRVDDPPKICPVCKKERAGITRPLFRQDVDFACHKCDREDCA